jgi:hypothetical protein
MRKQRHHFLPQLLLKGFASRVERDSHFVTVFRKGQEPFETNVINAAAKTGFHDGLDGCDLEGMLSTQESKYGPLVERLRGGFISARDKELIVDFIANLMVRTKNTREGLVELGEAFFYNLKQWLLDPTNSNDLEDYMLKQAASSSEVQTLLKILQLDCNEQNLRLILSSPRVDAFRKVRPFLEQVFAQIDMGTAAKEGQLRALRGQLEARREALRRFEWSLYQHPFGTFVLGDVGPLARFHGSVADLRTAVFPGVAEVIVLPISSKVLIIGRERVDNKILDVEELNVASVELSREFFIANQDTPRERKYLSRIGNRASYVEDLEVSDALKKFPALVFK